jgi:GntR family transcriptional regulator
MTPHRARTIRKANGKRSGKPAAIRKSHDTAQRHAKPAGLFNAESRTPLYHQIFLILRSKIDNGEYGEGDYLPSEREIADSFCVSRITAVRTLNELASSGLVIRERGRGTRVSFVGKGTVVRGPSRPRALSESRTLATGAVEDYLEALRRRPRDVAVYEFDYVAAPPGIATALHLAAEADVQFATRVWSFEDKPFNYLTTYVPAAIGRRWKRADLERAPLSELLERSGLAIGRIEEQVTAALADVVAAERLNVSLGYPLIKIIRTAFDTADRPIEHVIALYPPDRYQYHVTLMPRPRKRR